jgi:hypothetical protein
MVSHGKGGTHKRLKNRAHSPSNIIFTDIMNDFDYEIPPKA